MFGRIRTLRIYRRELLIRLKTFRFFILAFLVASSIGGITLHFTHRISYLRGMYEAIALMFFASTLDYPSSIALQIMWISYPMIGLILLADGLAGIGMSLKFGDASSEEWNKAVTRILKNHVIVVGIGNIGLKVLKELYEKEEVELVGIDKFDDKGREDEFMDYQAENKIPFIRGDATREKVLKEASIQKAQAIYILIDDDLLNIKIAMLAKDINPKVTTIVRMFDLEFASEVKDKLGMDYVLSTSSLSVPHFINAFKECTKSKETEEKDEK